MAVDQNNKLIETMMHVVQHYNPKKYWNYRKIVVSGESKVPKLIRVWMLYRIKRMDARNQASFGTGFGCGAQIEGVPELPHGLNGIICGYYCHIGKNCIIMQQVTISAGREDQFVEIGNNVCIGAGAKILGPCKIGDNVLIGANAVVTSDIPDGCTAVGVPAHVIEAKK